MHKKTTLLLIKLLLCVILTLQLSGQGFSISEGKFQNQCLWHKISFAEAFYIHKITLLPVDTKTHSSICKGNHSLESDISLLASKIPSFKDKEKSRVNPYRSSIQRKPFKLEFEQDTYFPPIDRKMFITSRFGMRHSGPHRGIDIDLITGDSVRTVLPGRVRFVGYSKGHGSTVVVRHEHGIETVYAHLSRTLVKANDLLPGGQAIGLGGNSGNSRGSHLHLEIRFEGICIHPEYVFNFDASNSIRNREIWINWLARSPRLHSAYRKSKIEEHDSLEAALSSEDALPKFHIVQKGDTLSHIAKAYSIGINEICTLNSISKKSVLSIGQIIEYR